MISAISVSLFKQFSDFTENNFPLLVQPLLADNATDRPKALLSISSMIHAYCRIHPSGCQTEEAVKEVIVQIENRIGIACRSRDAEEQNTILLALKALGNAGLVVSSTETLKKCYQVLRSK